MYVCIVCCEWLCVFGVEWGGLMVVREDGRRWEEGGIGVHVFSLLELFRLATKLGI